MLDQLNRLCLVIFIYIGLYGVVVFMHPEMVFDNQHNSLRQFGVGYKNTTIVPLWLISVLFELCMGLLGFPMLGCPTCPIGGLPIPGCGGEICKTCGRMVKADFRMCVISPFYAKTLVKHGILGI